MPDLFSNDIFQKKDPYTYLNQGVQDTVTYGTMFRSRLMAERSRLEFLYGVDQPRIYLPFYENPKISEKQSSNYAKYSPVGRSGNLYAYLGSESRSFRIEFKYTMDHLGAHDMGVSKFHRILDSKKAKQDLFLEGSQPTGVGGLSLAQGFRQEYLKKFYENNPPYSKGSAVEPPIDAAFFSNPESGFEQVTGNPLGSVQDVLTTKDNKMNLDSIISQLPITERDKVIDTLLLFINTIRSSTLNNSDDPSQGPPLIRLFYGSLYNSVPLICMNYSISFEEDTTYDLETLTPKILKISMDLEEVRVGDFGVFEAFSKVPSVSDNLVGWEALMNDPITFNKVPDSVNVTRSYQSYRDSDKAADIARYISALDELYFLDIGPLI